MSNNIKKVVILKNQLPAFNGEDQTYIVRYRIVSEDKNRTSHWSPQYHLAAPTSQTVEYGISLDPTKKIITVVWTAPTNTNNIFDMYVKWDNQSWEYFGSVSTTIFALVAKSGATSVKVSAQVPTFPKKKFTNATIFETPTTSLVV
jgi:hypothetical protein